MTTLYGIKNCDTVKKAIKWLNKHHIEHRFHDFRKDGIDADLVQGWLKSLDWETLVNKRSTTWKQLDEATKQKLSADNVVERLVAHPTLIKRPVLVTEHHVTVGFKAEHYQQLYS